MQKDEDLKIRHYYDYLQAALEIGKLTTPLVSEKIRQSQLKYKETYDNKHRGDTTLKVGMKVLKRVMKNLHRVGGKLDMRWEGPYIIEDINDHDACELTDCKTGRKLLQRWALDHLKR